MPLSCQRESYVMPTKRPRNFITLPFYDRSIDDGCKVGSVASTSGLGATSQCSVGFTHLRCEPLPAVLERASNIDLLQPETFRRLGATSLAQ